MSAHATSRGLLRSTGAATFLQLWRMTVLFGTNLVLRRWVDIGSWGLWNWAESLFLVIAALRDLGMSSHTVRLRPRPYGNFLHMQLVWGTTLGGLILLAAPLLALANADVDPNTIPLLRALAVYLLLEGLATVPLVYFEAELAIERTLVPELARSATYAGLALALAYHGAGVWSFVVAQLAATALYAALLWWRAWRRIPLVRARGATLGMIRGALPIGGVWLLGLAVMHLDPLVLGAHFRQETVAAYAFAYFAAFLTARILQPPMGRALYPALVAYRDDPHRGFEAYRLATLFLLAVEVPAALFLATNAELVLRLLGGAQWGDAPAYLRLLAFAPLVDPLGRFGGELLIAHHLERVRVLAIATTLVTMLGGALLLIRVMGPQGMAVANFLPFGPLVAAWGVYRVAGNRLWPLVHDLLGVYLLPLPLFLAAYLAAGENPWLRAGLTALAAIVALGLQWRRFGSGFLEFFRRPVADAVEVVTPAPNTLS
jgi:O-antigen/teichoic acid export membrane protein